MKLVKQQFMCERIVASMFNFEASVVKLFLMFLEAVAKPNDSRLTDCPANRHRQLAPLPDALGVSGFTGIRPKLANIYCIISSHDQIEA